MWTSATSSSVHCEKVAEGEFKVEYCTTASMLADIFTKALAIGRIAFNLREFEHSLGLVTSRCDST
jgi:hypothetical protein